MFLNPWLVVSGKFSMAGFVRGMTLNAGRDNRNALSLIVESNLCFKEEGKQICSSIKGEMS